MIFCRTPYYKDIPWNRPSDAAKADSFTLELFIYTGDKVTDLPGTATYSKTIENVESSTGTQKVDIARLIADYIPTSTSTSTDTEILNGNNSVWVKHQVKYLVGASETTELVETDLATNGYSYSMEGENFETSKTLLSEVSEIDAYSQSTVQVPILLEDATVKIKVTAYPSATELLNEDLAATTESAERISIVNINCKDADESTHIIVNYKGADLYTIYLRGECKHTPVDVTFLNRSGHQQTMTFFKKRVDSLDVTGESYQNRFDQPSTGAHQFVDFNKDGRSSFTLNTGFIEEEANELTRQLFLSEYVWLGVTPVNIDSKQFEYQTTTNNKLIKYTVNFKYSFTEINTI